MKYLCMHAICQAMGSHRSIMIQDSSVELAIALQICYIIPSMVTERKRCCLVPKHLHLHATEL